MNALYAAVFGLYLVVVLLIGVWANRRSSGLEDLWMYGRELGPLLATWALIANFVSTVSVVGIVGAIYVDGYSIMLNIAFGLLLGVSGLYFVADRIRSLEYMTLSDIIVDLTDYEISRPIAGVVLLINSWLYVLMQLVGASILVTTITGIDYRYLVWIIAIVFITYTVLGGLVGVAWTDFIQGTVMVSAVVIVTGYLVADFGGVTAVNTQLSEIDPELVTPLEPNQTLLGVLGTMIAFFGTLFTSQNAIIHMNAARDLRVAKSHIAIGGAILSVFYLFLITLGGASVVALHSEGVPVDNPDAAFPLVLTEIFPPELGVLLILAAMGAVLSTTDTMLHSVGVTAAHDIYSYFNPDASDAKKLQMFRLSIIVGGLIAAGVAIDPPATIIGLFYFRAVLLTCAFIVPVYGALYWKGASPESIITGIVVGVVVGVGWTFVGPAAIPGTLVGLVASGLALVGVAKLGRLRSPEPTN